MEESHVNNENEFNDFDFNTVKIINILVVGDKDVGKTSLINKFMNFPDKNNQI